MKRLLRWLHLASKPPNHPEGEGLRRTLEGMHDSARGWERRPLERSDGLDAAAQHLAVWMAKHGELTHGNNLASRVAHNGYPAASVGENIATSYHTPEDVMAAWMSSKHHRQNIMGDWVHIGIGVAVGKRGQLWWVVIFGRPVVVLLTNPRGLQAPELEE